MHRVPMRAFIRMLALFLMGDAHATGKPYTIEDHLAIAQIASAHSGGNVAAWTMTMPYREAGYYGHGTNGPWEHAGAAVHLTEISAGQLKTGPLFEPEPGTSYILQSISPDERFVVYCFARAADFGLGIYDRRSQSRRAYGLVPAAGECEAGSLIWLSAEEFLLLASGSERPPTVAARPYSGGRLAEERARAWVGGLSVDLQDAGADRSAKEMADRAVIVRVNARTGVVTLLASGSLKGLSISPSGRFAAATRTRSGAEGAGASGCRANTSEGRELLVFDLSTGQDVMLVAPHLAVAVDSLNWSTTADRMAFFACSGTDLSMTVYGWDATNGTLTRFVHSGLDLASRRERGLFQRPERFVWLGGRVAVYAREHDGDDARFTPRDVHLFGGEAQLPRADWYLIDAEGKSRNLTHAMKEVSPHVLFASEDSMVVAAGDNLWRVFADGDPKPLTEFGRARIDLPVSDGFAPDLAPFRRHAVLVDSGQDPAFLIVDTSTGATRRVRSPGPDAEYVASATEAAAVLFRFDDGQGTRLVLAREDGSSQVLAILNRHMEQVERTRWQTISHEIAVSGDVHRTESCILFPPGFDPGRRYPVIVDVYPTRRAHCTQPSWQKFVEMGRSPSSFSPHLLAGRGYIVFQPNAAVELIRSEEDPLGTFTSVVEQGVNTLIDRGFADRSRIGLVGFSQGGFSSLRIAAQSTMFSAVVSMNGWSDHYVHFYDTTYLQEFYADEFGFHGAVGRYLPSVGTAFAMGRSPHEDAEAYLRGSPLFLAERISAPVLLIHSDMDMFPLHQYERMYVALKHHGKRARLLRYWGEGHGPSSPENMRHMWGQIFDWFDEAFGK